MISAALFLSAGLALSGCTTSGLAMMGADAMTQAASGRSITGNVIYAMTGKDCMPLNVLTGKPMCPDEEAAAAAAKEENSHLLLSHPGAGRLPHGARSDDVADDTPLSDGGKGQSRKRQPRRR